jgi:hypothetical protein
LPIGINSPTIIAGQWLTPRLAPQGMEIRHRLLAVFLTNLIFFHFVIEYMDCYYPCRLLQKSSTPSVLIKAAENRLLSLNN